MSPIKSHPSPGVIVWLSGLVTKFRWSKLDFLKRNCVLRTQHSRSFTKQGERKRPVDGKICLFALVAQLDRALGCGPRGRRFKSCRAHFLEGGQDGNALVSKTNERKL
ncbi:MAG: hypothetical protein UV30_C0024G0011 [Candidatus Collierbacteria bacterium GW2011_GWF1_42_50]|nr:MAG: hypothetical protein UV30_C0024G0011 [Candidatus Collierbacteria bacterium GW2011_GWF1_42_50]